MKGERVSKNRRERVWSRDEGVVATPRSSAGAGFLYCKEYRLPFSSLIHKNLPQKYEDPVAAVQSDSN